MNKIQYKEYMTENRAWIKQAMNTILKLNKLFSPTAYDGWLFEMTVNELKSRAIKYYGKAAIDYDEYRAFLSIFERS